LSACVGLQEPQVWANNTKHDSVIFSDNDYEIFISADGSSHYYKEYEMSAQNANWDLCLKRAYRDGGGKNSSQCLEMTGPYHIFAIYTALTMYFPRFASGKSEKF